MSGKRFGFFPSYALGWMMSNEPWFEKLRDKVNLLKIRGSYGLVGNDKTGAGRFPFYTTVGDAGGYTFGIDGNKGFGGAAEGLVGSPNLSWEKSKKANIGVEIGLFDKLTLIADVFKENRTDIFVRRNSLSSVIGITPGNLPSANMGEMNNQGVDVTADFKEQIGKVQIGVFGNFTFNRNKVISTEQPSALYSYQEREGRKLYGTIDMSKQTGMGYVSLGLFKDQNEIDNSPRQTMASELKPGDIKYKDVNGDGVIDNYDMVFMQNNTPEIIYGFGVSLLYKGFDFSLFFQGLGNSNIFLPEDVNPFYHETGRGNILQDVADKVFIPAEISGDPATENYDAIYPRMSQANERNNTVRSDYWLRSTSFLRLKNAELGYTLPQSTTKKLMVSRARIYVSGTNLFVFDSLKLWDPEVSGYGSYPVNMIGTLGIKLDF
jgi:TonB-linked SusC/RagA family outer membrane protein